LLGPKFPDGVADAILIEKQLVGFLFLILIKKQ
jgi:hypothetical protein